MKKNLYYALLLLLNVSLLAESNLSVLFIGNSYTAQSKATIQSLFKEEQINADLQFFTSGGKKLIWHAEQPKLHELMASRKWTWIVLQEQSQTPAYSGLRSTFMKGVKELQKPLKESAKKSLLFMTWGRRDGDKRNIDLAPDFKTMQKLLKEGYEKAGRKYKMDVADIGLVWAEIYKKDKEFFKELYKKDGSHPSEKGAYVNALCFATIFTKKDPRKIQFKQGVTAEEAKLIKQAVYKLIKP